MVVGSFFVLNLFVGVVISNFNNQKDKLGKFISFKFVAKRMA